jgi:hypothetical protein
MVFLAVVLGNHTLMEMEPSSNKVKLNPLSYLPLRVRYIHSQAFRRYYIFGLAVLLSANGYIGTAIFTAIAGFVLLISNEAISRKAQRALDLAEQEGFRVEEVDPEEYGIIKIHKIQ